MPYSVAGDLGERERKAACELPIITFTSDEPQLSAVPADFAASDDGWDEFFGRSGNTKASHMLTVTRRSACWPVARPPVKKGGKCGEYFHLQGILAYLVQAFPSFFYQLSVGVRVHRTNNNMLFIYTRISRCEFNL